MMTIDEAIAHERAKADKARESEALFLHDDLMRNAKESHKRLEEYEQIAEWLEELKAYREGIKMNCDRLNKALEKGKKVGYNKAIDDFYILFISEVKNRYPDMPIFNFRLQRSVWEMENAKYIECEEIALKIAEQLKKGGADAGSI